MIIHCGASMYVGSCLLPCTPCGLQSSGTLKKAKPFKLFVLQEDDPSLWRQRELRKHGQFGLITYRCGNHESA